MENKETLENTQENIEATQEVETEIETTEEVVENVEEDEIIQEEEKSAKKTSKREKEKSKEMEIITNVNGVQKTVKRSFLQKESTEQRRVGKREVTIEKTVFKTDEKGEIVLKDEKPVLVREAKKIYV